MWCTGSSRASERKKFLAKTMGRLVQTLGPEVVQQIHQRMVGVAQEKKVVQGRKLRVDTTVVS